MPITRFAALPGRRSVDPGLDDQGRSDWPPPSEPHAKGKYVDEEVAGQPSTSRKVCPLATSNTRDPGWRTLAGRAVRCAVVFRESRVSQTGLPPSTTTSPAGIGPAEPSCTSATGWPAGPYLSLIH